MPRDAVVLRRGNVDGHIGTTADDIDFEYSKLGATGNNWLVRPQRRSQVTQGDVDTLVRTILHSQYGDANLDGHVDSVDFTYLASNFNTQSGAGWARGDFNGDHAVDLSDFTTLAANFNFVYSGDTAGAINAGLGGSGAGADGSDGSGAFGAAAGAATFQLTLSLTFVLSS